MSGSKKKTVLGVEGIEDGLMGMGRAVEAGGPWVHVEMDRIPEWRGADIRITSDFEKDFNDPNYFDHDQDGNILHRFSWQLQTALGPFDPGYGSEGGEPEVESVFEWSLMSDAGGAPGSLLTAPGQLSAYPSGIAVFYYAANPTWGDPAIQANTSYWLALKFLYVGGGATLGQYANLPVTTDTATNGSGSLGALMQNTGSGWTGLTERAVLQVQVESVPEPGSAGLVALGLLCVLANRRRGRK